VKSRGTLRERIIRVLLVKPDGSLTKYGLAKKAQCSFSWAHEFLRKLETLTLIDGTKVTNYPGLIQYWLQVKTNAEKKEYMHKDPLSLLNKARILLSAISSLHAPTFTSKEKTQKNGTSS
jgi:predicted transcriptional regulator